MPNESNEGVKFAASVRGKDLPSEDLRAIRVGEKSRMERLIRNFSCSKIHELTDGETSSLSILLGVAASKLIEMGIENPQAILPSADTFIFEEVDPNTTCRKVGAEVGMNKGYVLISFHSPLSLSDVSQRYEIFHEISHYTSVAVYDRGSDGALRESMLGFSRYYVNKDKRKSFVKGVLWEEAPADLFALYCTDSSDAISDCYRYDTPFLIALISKFSQLTKQEPLGVFKNIFCAKTFGDFSIFSQLVSVFGKDVVKKINNLTGGSNDKKSADKIADIAREGGFFEIYDDIQRKVNAGGFVDVSEYIPGLKGRIALKSKERI